MILTWIICRAGPADSAQQGNGLKKCLCATWANINYKTENERRGEENKGGSGKERTWKRQRKKGRKEMKWWFPVKLPTCADHHCSESEFC